VNHVGSLDVGRTAPPMVAMLLHSVNPQLTAVLWIQSQAELDDARWRPSWMRNVSMKAESVGRGALALDGLPSIRCTLASPLALFSSPRYLRILELHGSRVTNNDIQGIEHCVNLKNRSLMSCKRIASVANLAALRSLKTLDLGGTRVTHEGLVGIESIAKLEELSLSVTRLAASNSLNKTGSRWHTDYGRRLCRARRC
jgi:hypothetical protein